jgi:hypothetical protein
VSDRDELVAHPALVRLLSTSTLAPFGLERARIGLSGVGLGGVVSDLLERKGFEFGREIA